MRKNREIPASTLDQQLEELRAARKAHDKSMPTTPVEYRHSAEVRAAAYEIKRLGGAGLRKMKAGEVDDYATLIMMPDSQARNLNKQDKIDRLLVIADKVATENQEDERTARDDEQFRRAKFFWHAKSNAFDARLSYVVAMLESQDPRSLRYSQAEDLIVQSARVRVFEEMASYEEVTRHEDGVDTGELVALDAIRDHYVRFLVRKANDNPMSRSSGVLVNLVDDVERSIVAREMDYGVFSRWGW